MLFSDARSHVHMKSHWHSGLNAENWIQPYRTLLLFSFQKGSINNNKVLALFTQTLALDLLKTKTSFVNPDEHTVLNLMYKFIDLGLIIRI